MSGRKFDRKKHKDLRDYKSKEIKKSLTHRARLRKNYFKLLEKEGVKPAELPEQNQNESSDEEDHAPKPKRSMPPQKAQFNQQKSQYNQQKRLTYTEKAELIKKRKEEKRKNMLEDIRRKKQLMDKANEKREKMKTKLDEKTKHGQPLMAPRINKMLDQIRRDMN